VDPAGNTTVYLYGDFDESTLVTATVDTPTGGGTPVVTEYVHEQGTRFLTALRRDGDWFSVATDVVGTPIVVIDDTGTVVLSRDYTAWGVLRSSTGTFDLPIGYGGGIDDADTGLVRMGVRDYDPATGRWLQPDPTLIDSGDANLYRYVRNQPTTLQDLTGAAAGSIQVCAYGACIEFEVACDDSGCSVCLGGGGGTPGGGVGFNPNQGRRGQEIYAQNSCSAGPFEIGFECRIILCAKSNPDVAQAKCEIKGPVKTQFENGMTDLSLGCSSTLGGCAPI
jgi:RHS repeat-associated protein